MKKVIVSVLLILQCISIYGFFLIVPEDIAMSITTSMGFAPKIRKGNDHRIGFGYRFGNHADFQILYEFGPQIITSPSYQVKRVSRQREIRRPILEFLVRTGILKIVSYQNNVVHTTDKTKGLIKEI